MKRIAATTLLVLAISTNAQNWPGFRGNQAAGVGAGKLPTTWNITKGTNVAWKVSVPGLGLSSPIAWGDRIYVTTAVPQQGKAEVDAKNSNEKVAHANDQVPHEWRLIAIERDSGRIAWSTVASSGTPPGKRHVKSSYANPTPATDGKTIVAAFADGTLAAFSMKGKLVWKHSYNVPAKPEADAINDVTTSPAIYKNLVIHQHDFEPVGYLAAYDLRTGKEVWKVERDEKYTWSSPAVFRIAGRDVLVTNSWRNARAQDPLTGKELWRMRARKGSFDRGPAPLQAGDLTIIAGGGPEQPVFAIKPTASGELVNLADQPLSEHVAWATERGSPYIPTPLIVDDLLYVLTDKGILSAYGTRDGKRLYQQRISETAGSFSASPVASGGHLYISSDDGEVFVVRAGMNFELVATNSMNEALLASPAVAGNMLVLRTPSTLYGIAHNLKK